MTLKLITFDCTGTLLVLREAIGYHYAKIGLRHGINIQPDLLTENFKTAFKNMLLEHPNFGQGSIGWSEWWKKCVFCTFQDSKSPNTSLDISALNKVSYDLIELYKTKECWKVVEGAEDLLEQLQSKRIGLGVISNYDPRLEDILKDLNILKYFDFVQTSYNAKCWKPHAEIFEIVENMNDEIKKSEILHVGDDPKLDFIAARDVGWNALLIAENGSKISQGIPKDWIVKSMKDICNTLDRKGMLPCTNNV